MTFLATANCGVYVGATPGFTDVDPSTVSMTASLLEPVLSERTRAVLPVHFAGLPCDMPALSALVRARCPRAVIARTPATHWERRTLTGLRSRALRWADMATMSFHPVKHIAAGEGGRRPDGLRRARRATASAAFARNSPILPC